MERARVAATAQDCTPPARLRRKNRKTLQNARAFSHQGIGSRCGMHNKSGKWLVGGVVVVVAGAGCGAASAVRPKEITAAQAMGEASCTTVGTEADPLVVDLSPDLRGNLEVAMRKGVAVVSYDCKKLKILEDCTIESEDAYRFTGIVLKEQLLELEDTDQIKANLPLSGVGLAAKLEGELARGSSLNLAM